MAEKKNPLTPWTDGSPVLPKSCALHTGMDLCTWAEREGEGEGPLERRWPTLEFDGANERVACQECSQWDWEHMMPKHGKQCATCTVRPSGFEERE